MVMLGRKEGLWLYGVVGRRGVSEEFSLALETSKAKLTRGTIGGGVLILPMFTAIIRKTGTGD